MFTTEDVKINTVQIEIKSLTVGRKQLTLSLMRQIIEEDIVDHVMLQFKGVPWGHINYFWGDDKSLSYPKYINLIWQKGNALRRCVIQMSKPVQFHEEERARRRAAKLKNELESLNKHLEANKQLWIEKQIAQREEELKEEMEDIEGHEEHRLVYIPGYNELVKPLRNLEHFYIAV